MNLSPRIPILLRLNASRLLVDGSEGLQSVEVVCREFGRHSPIVQDHNPISPLRHRRFVRHDDDGPTLRLVQIL